MTRQLAYRRHIHNVAALGTLAATAIAAFGQVSPPPPPVPGTSQPAVDKPKTGPAPKVWLSKTEWNFGHIWWGDPCTIEIDVRNDGDAPLQIANVRTSCGCTGAKPGKNSLAPGESDKIRLTYDSKKGVVNVSQSATVESNDPVNPNVVIQIRGEIRNLFEGKPSQTLLFGTITGDAQETQSITLTNNLDKPVTLKLGDLPPNTPYDVKLEELTAGKEYKLSATTKPPLQAGSRFVELHLLTGLPDRPEMKVTINAFVQERVSCQPTQIMVFSNQVGPVTGRDLRVNFLKDKPLKITGVKSSHPDLIKAVFVPETPGIKQEIGAFAYHKISLDLPEFDKIPDTGVTVEVTTDDPEPRFQTFTVPVVKQRINPPPGQTTPPAPPTPAPPKPAPPKVTVPVKPAENPPASQPAKPGN